MEADFDKEIDALLRREAAGRTITISEFRGGLHLDADEIVAFAEKKVPPTVRAAFVEHFAACDRCRKILLNTAWLNAEETPRAEASVAAPAAEPAMPWYRGLFVFPQLAYVMGALVVLFAGFIGVSVLTRSYNTGQSDISSSAVPDSQMERAAPSAANANSTTVYSSNSTANSTSSNVAANSAANSAANVPGAGVAPAAPSSAMNSNTSAAQKPAAGQPADEKMLRAEPKAEAPAAAAPPLTLAKRENLPASTADIAAAESENARKVQEMRVTQGSQPAPRMSQMPKPKSPARADQRERSGLLDGVDRKAQRNEAPSGASGGAATPRKYVGGRAFELKQGVWYDTSYRSQGTINVRRDSKEYRKLDSGLRSIGDSFMGQVVVVDWNGKAYRIQ